MISPGSSRSLYHIVLFKFHIPITFFILQSYSRCIKIARKWGFLQNTAVKLHMRKVLSQRLMGPDGAGLLPNETRTLL